MTDIIFPDESKMKPQDLDQPKEALIILLANKDTLSYPQNLESLKQNLAKIKGYLLVADRKKLPEYFDYFFQINFLVVFNQFLNANVLEASFIILETLNFLTTNLTNTKVLEHLYSEKYDTNIIGQKMNIIDKIISLSSSKNNDEFLTYQINFMKSLSLKINIDTIKYFYDCNINQFPILTKAFSLYNHKDPLVRNVVKSIFLAIIKIDEPNLRNFMAAFPNNLYYPNLIFGLKTTILKLCEIDLGDERNKNLYEDLQKQHDILIDSILYLSDLLSLNIENINYILINSLLNEILFPLLNAIISEKKGVISFVHSFYILSLFFFSFKNKYIIDFITFCLFNENIPDFLLDKINGSAFGKLDQHLLKCINFLITNNMYADVNEPYWKKISEYMRVINGIDLSTGEIDPNNSFDKIKNLLKNNNENIGNNVSNTIFANVKLFFISRDDTIILVLNLLTYFLINFYSKEIDKNNDNKDNAENKDKKNNNDNNNLIIDNDENNDFCLINDNENQNIKEKNSISNNFKNNNNPILTYPFFIMDLKNLDNDKSENLFQKLLSFIKSKTNFRLSTVEVILISIKNMVNFYLKLNNNDNNIKKTLINILSQLLKNEFVKFREFMNKEQNLSKYYIDSFLKAYEYYVKNFDKKINDLMTLPPILIPAIYVERFDEVPPNLRTVQFNYELLKIYIYKIIFIYDTINELNDKKQDCIKSNKFPIEIPTLKFNLGKEYCEKELGENYVHCQIYRNNNLIKCQCILSDDTVYFGEVMSGNFKDLSRIKIFKKIPMRYLDVKNGERDVELLLFDKTNEMTAKKGFSMNCLNPINTVKMKEYLNNNIQSCLFFEESLFMSFFDEINNKISSQIE